MTPRNSALLVDDDNAVGMVLLALLTQAGFEAVHVPSAESALKVLEKRPFDVVVSDVRMPGLDGMQLLDQLGEKWPETPVILLTAHGTVPQAVEAMKRGAADFVLKPFDREEVLFAVRKAITKGEGTPVSSARAKGLTSASPAMAKVADLVARAANGTATVLIRGESGTGKELIARAIHEQSPRKSGPLVKVHCAALPENLLESELFGYEKGAFTGAANRKPGRAELAGGGTLFLDEIAEVPLAVQAKLLRLIQERELNRLGGTETLKVDVRFVAATHRPLEEMVQQGTFREDLFYRLNVVPIFLPPLRNRPEEIAPLATHFCAKFAAANGKKVALAPEAVALLSTEKWPGNVRQLENFIERLVVLAQADTLDAATIGQELSRAPAGPVSAAAGAKLGEKVKETEHEALRRALAEAKGNRTVAARLLGVSRRTLYNKLEEHGLG